MITSDRDRYRTAVVAQFSEPTFRVQPSGCLLLTGRVWESDLWLWTRLTLSFNHLTSSAPHARVQRLVGQRNTHHTTVWVFPFPRPGTIAHDAAFPKLAPSTRDHHPRKLLTLACQSLLQILFGLRKLGIQFQSLPIISNRLIIFMFVVMSIAPTLVGFSVVGR